MATFRPNTSPLSAVAPLRSAELVASVEYGNADLIERLAPDWRQLCEQGVRNEPFYRPEWIAAYVRAFARNQTLLLLTAYAGSRLRGVLPLISSSGLFCGLPARMLRSASNVHSCRFDLICAASDAQATCACLWERLKRLGGWDVLCLEDVPVGGAGEGLLSLAAAEGWLTGQWESTASPFMSIANVADPVAIAPSSHFRQNLRRRMRKASATWSVETRHVRSPAAADLETFYLLESRSWKGKERTAILFSTDTREFYDAVARAGAAFGYFALNLLEFSCVPVAGHFGLVYQGRYYTPKVAYDEQYATYGPGHLLVAAAIRDCVTRGLTEYDFLGPSMPWKQEWTTQVRAHSHCYIFRKNTFGRLLHAAKFKLMSTARSIIRHPRMAPLREALKH